jgi:hypothetical protein
MRQPRQFRTMGNDALPPVGIGDQDMCAAIRQSEGQFVALPPGVERHRDRAENRGGEQGHRPFGQVAHGNRHAVPLAHAQFRQMGGERGDRAMPGIERNPLRAIDKERAVPVLAGQGGQSAEMRQGVLPHARRHARIVTVSISNGMPGAQSFARTSSSDIAGQPAGMAGSVRLWPHGRWHGVALSW